MDWTLARDALSSHFEVVDSSDVFLALQLHAGERQQMVMVSFSEGDRGPSWLRIESAFAPVEPDAMSTAIQYIGMDENLGVGIGRLQDFLVIRWTSPLEQLSNDVLIGMIDGVAGHADRLEASVSGGHDAF